MATQRFPAAQYAAFHGSDGNLKNFSDFLVPQIFQIAKHHGLAKTRVNPGQGFFDQHMLFAIESPVKRRPPAIPKRAFTRLGILKLLLQPDLVMPVPEQPPPPVVALIYGDAVDPGPQSALRTELPNAPEDFQEDFLSDVASIA
jgi:hypothetical protein